MGFAQTTQSDQIKGKMDDSGQCFAECPGAKLCHILKVYLGNILTGSIDFWVLRKHFLGVELFHCYEAS